MGFPFHGAAKTAADPVPAPLNFSNQPAILKDIINA